MPRFDYAKVLPALTAPWQDWNIIITSLVLKNPFFV
jgi:hypothetical protein